MAGRLRIDRAGFLYHVLNRRVARLPLFERDGDYASFEKVLDAYGFTPKRDILAQLLKPNHQVAKRIDTGKPVTPPGIPPGYANPDELVTTDCIRPAE